jgi:hypothetical protein
MRRAALLLVPLVGLGAGATALAQGGAGRTYRRCEPRMPAPPQPAPEPPAVSGGGEG